MLIDRIRHWASHDPHKCALIQHDRPLSYSALWALIRQVVIALDEHGLPPDGNAAILIKDMLTAWLVGIALRSRGLDTIAIRKESDIGSLAMRSLGCVVVSGPEWGDKVPSGPRAARIIALDTIGSRGLPEDSAAGSLERPERSGGHILYTSGTTGVYKKILFDAAREDRRNERRARALRLGSHSVFNCANFGLWTGQGYKMPAALWHVGGTIVFDRREKMIENIFDHGTTDISLLPPMYRRLVEIHRDCPAPRWPGVHINASSGFLPLGIAEGIVGKISPKLSILFTATELVDVPLRSDFTDTDDLYWLTIENGCDVEVVTEDGMPCPAGEEGFLRVRLTEEDAQSYLDDEAASAAVFRHGCFYPGDMAIQRADGRVRILGRVSDVINLQGQKVAVAPLEQDLQHYLGVEEVCLFSWQNDKAQDEILIAIQSGSQVNREKLDSVARKFSGSESVRVFVRKAFPRTEMGTQKVRRLVLKNQLINGE